MKNEKTEVEHIKMFYFKQFIFKTYKHISKNRNLYNDNVRNGIIYSTIITSVHYCVNNYSGYKNTKLKSADWFISGFICGSLTWLPFPIYMSLCLPIMITSSYIVGKFENN